MGFETGLLLIVAIAILAAVVWMGAAMKGELKALRRKLDSLETADATSAPAGAKTNPRLAAAREAAAARSAKRPGRTTVKRI